MGSTWKSAVIVVFLANVINDYVDQSLQMMTWPERECNRWRRFLSTKNHPVDIMAFAELRRFSDVPDPVVTSKIEIERKYKRQARYEREKERRYLWWLQMDSRADYLHLYPLLCQSFQSKGVRIFLFC